MIERLFASPPTAIAVFILIILFCKVYNAGKKLFIILVLVGLAYVGINYMGQAGLLW